MKKYQKYKFTVTVEFFANKKNPLKHYNEFFEDWDNSFMEIKGADFADVSDPVLMYDISHPEEIETAEGFLCEED